jgi:hypothetical protein
MWETYLENLESLESPSPLLKDKILNAIEAGVAGLSD